MRQLMVEGPTVELGPGDMGPPVEGRPDESQAIGTVHAAVARSTGDREAVLVAIVDGHARGRDGSWAPNGRPDSLGSAPEPASLDGR